MPSNAALVFHNVTLSYEGHPAIHHLSASLNQGSLTALMGPNGAGKSTLLRGIMGLHPLSTGSITKTSGAIAMLPQLPDLDRNFPVTVMDVVNMGHYACCGHFRRITAHDQDISRQAIETVELHGFEHRTIGTLSAGQMQRLLFARLIVQNASVILLDEPFAGVDARTTATLMQLIKQWHAQGRTIVCSLHDMPFVRDHFPETLLIARELVAHGTTATALNDRHLQQARAMAEAFDDDAPLCLPLVA